MDNQVIARLRRKIAALKESGAPLAKIQELEAQLPQEEPEKALPVYRQAPAQMVVAHDNPEVQVVLIQPANFPPPAELVKAVEKAEPEKAEEPPKRKPGRPPKAATKE